MIGLNRADVHTLRRVARALGGRLDGSHYPKEGGSTCLGIEVPRCPHGAVFAMGASIASVDSGLARTLTGYVIRSTPLVGGSTMVYWPSLTIY